MGNRAPTSQTTSPEHRGQPARVHARTKRGLIVRMNNAYLVTIPRTRYTLYSRFEIQASCEKKAIEEAVRQVALNRVDQEAIERHGIPLNFASIFADPDDRPAGFSIERIPSDDTPRGTVADALPPQADQQQEFPEGFPI